MDLDITNTTVIFADFSRNLSEVYRRGLPTRVLGSILTLLMGVASVLGNLAVIFASFRVQALRSQPNNLLLVYLAMIDIITGLVATIPAGLGVAFDGWTIHSSNLFCKLQNALAYGCLCTSSFNISFITLDRAVAVIRPLQYHSIMTTKRFIWFGICLFLLEMIIIFPILIMDWTSFNYIEAICVFDMDLPETQYFATLFAFVTCFYIPALCILICNLLIIFAASKSKAMVLFVRRCRAVPVEKVSKTPIMNKTVTSVIVLVVTYCISVAPYIIITNINVVSLDGHSSPPLIQYLSFMLMFLSSAVNPFIYGIFRKDYRSAYKKIAPKSFQKYFGAD